MYQALKEKAGAKNVSKMINQILIDYFAKGESMFGTIKKVDTMDLRKHEERLLEKGLNPLFDGDFREVCYRLLRID